MMLWAVLYYHTLGILVTLVLTLLSAYGMEVCITAAQMTKQFRNRFAD